MQAINRQWLLASRPQGKLKPGDFTWHEEPMSPPDLQEGELLVHNRYFLCAPTIRNFLNAPGRSYRTSVPVGAPISGVVGSEVIASRDPAYPVGCRVTTMARWDLKSWRWPSRCLWRRSIWTVDKAICTSGLPVSFGFRAK